VRTVVLRLNQKGAQLIKPVLFCYVHFGVLLLDHSANVLGLAGGCASDQHLRSGVLPGRGDRNSLLVGDSPKRSLVETWNWRSRCFDQWVLNDLPYDVSGYGQARRNQWHATLNLPIQLKQEAENGRQTKGFAKSVYSVGCG